MVEGYGSVRLRAGLAVSLGVCSRVSLDMGGGERRESVRLWVRWAAEEIEDLLFALDRVSPVVFTDTFRPDGAMVPECNTRDEGSEVDEAYGARDKYHNKECQGEIAQVLLACFNDAER